MLGRTVSELDKTMSSSEFTEWQAFLQLEPTGSRIDDARTAFICKTIADGLMPRKDGMTWPTEDFMPRWGIAANEDDADAGESKESIQSPEDQLRAAILITKVLREMNKGDGQ